MSKPVIKIDGSKFSTLEEFYEHFSELANCDPIDNLDAFDDVLRGGCGTPEGGFTLVWENHDLSKERLGYSETARQLRKQLERCHPSNVDSIQEEIANAENHTGPTTYDELLEIILIHCPGGDEESDNIDLVLQ